MRRSLLVPLLSCLLLLAGCGHDDGAVRKGPETSVGSRTTGPGAGGLKAYYDQKLRWTGCGKDLCASLRVPVDYAHPQRASIGLAVEKAPATGHRVGALIANPGGPGASGTILASDRDEFFGQPLISAYDIVGFDPRGTGRSDPVDCLSDRQLTDFIAEDPAPDDAAEAKAYSGMTRTFWRGCKERSDALAGHVSTVEAARDMDVLRAALGQKKMDYFGFSYGTELGATYAELFPKQVGRMVLDGAVDVALSTRESALHQAAGFETALRAYVGHCVEAGRCFLGPTVDAGLQRIKRLLESVDRHPMRTSKGRRLTVGNAFYGIVAPLYSRDLWSYLDTGLRQALAGDGTVLLTLSDAYTMRRDDGSYSDNSMEAISVISCLDDPWSISAAQVPGQVAAFREASPTFGEVFAWGLTSCAGDPYRSHDRPGLTIDAAGAAPIVVVGTTRDPATPYEEAVALAHELRSGVLLTRDGDGHTGYHQGNPCIDDAVEGYLVKGTVPADGTRC